jgi:DNA polymerase I
MSGNFNSVVVCDFEYEVAPGDLPNVLCMVAYVLDENLRHVRTIRLWQGEFGSTPPFDVGPDSLFVAYSAWAEMTCFQVLGWQFPVHIFDEHTAYLAASNILLPYNPDEVRKKLRKGLEEACRTFGLDGWKGIDKNTIRTAIANGTWRERYSPQEVLDYCGEDVRMETQLLRAQLPLGTDVGRVLHWSNYSAKAIARIQARGMPIDMPLWNLVQENKPAVIGELLRQFDPSFGDEEPIYTPEGEWNYTRFARWLVRAGVHAWPRLESGQLDTDSDAFRLMYHAHPGVEAVHALRDSIGFIAKARLPVGKDGRNRPSLFPFGTATGRNAHAKSPYNAHAGMRGFMVCPPGSTIFYLDWRSQEVGVAAAHSGDEHLKVDYSGDIYHALARLCGLTDDHDPVRWKRDHRAQRDRMKPLQLGINYGMGVPSLARGLDRHPLIASEIIQRHKRRYPRFWQWRADMVQKAMLDRRIESMFGWPLHLTHSPNQRTLYNFPMQSGGAEMLRLAAMRLCDAGIVPIMLIHDGILFEETDKEKIAHAIEIMRGAGRDVCDGFEIGVDVDQLLDGGARYQDKRPVAQKMWATIMIALQTIGALPERAVA